MYQWYYIIVKPGTRHSILCWKVGCNARMADMFFLVVYTKDSKCLLTHHLSVARCDVGRLYTLPVLVVVGGLCLGYLDRVRTMI